MTANANVGWAKRSVPTADLQITLTLTWARRYAPLPTLRALGLHWGQFPEQWEVKNKEKSPTEAMLTQGDERYIEGMSGMTLAIPAWHIRAFLDRPKLVNERNEAISEILSERGTKRGPVAESSAPPTAD